MCPAILCWLSYLSTDFGLWRFTLIILIIIWPKNNVYIFLTVAYTILLSLAFSVTSYSSNLQARHDNAVVYTDGSVLRGQRSGWVSRREWTVKSVLGTAVHITASIRLGIEAAIAALRWLLSLTRSLYWMVVAWVATINGDLNLAGTYMNLLSGTRRCS